MSDQDRIRYIDMPYSAAGSIRGRADMKAFLRDLLTVSERVMLGRRITIARMLIAERSYADITLALGTSKATVRRVHRWLLDQHEGYEKAIKGLKKELDSRNTRNMYRSDTVLRRLKKRYPLYFLLFSAGKHNKQKR